MRYFLTSSPYLAPITASAALVHPGILACGVLHAELTETLAANMMMPMMWVFIIQWNNVLSYKSETFLYNHCTSVRNQFKFSQLIAVTLCSHSVTCCKCQWSLSFSVILLLNLLSLWRCLFVYCLSLTHERFMNTAVHWSYEILCLDLVLQPLLGKLFFISSSL